MKDGFVTRDLTREESQELLSKLHLKLGKAAQVDAVLGVIAELGLGIFVVEKERA